MKKMNLVLAACLFAMSLNAQLLSVPSPIKTELLSDASSDLKVTKMNRPQSQLSRITVGETLAQIAVMKQKKRLILSILNVNPQMKFTIEDEKGEVLITENIKKNITMNYNLEQLPVGDYVVTLSGSGIVMKRFFTLTSSQISLNDNLSL